MKKHLMCVLLVGALGCGGASESGPQGASCPATAPLDCGGGKCCASAYPYHCASNSKCYQTAAGAQAACGSSYTACSGSTASGGSSSTSGGGGGNGSMGACGTCSGQTECSGWISGSACNWQSCACYFVLNGSDTYKEWYHSSDGQCFQCDTTGTTCQGAAQSLINHCYGY